VRSERSGGEERKDRGRVDIGNIDLTEDAAMRRLPAAAPEPQGYSGQLTFRCAGVVESIIWGRIGSSTAGHDRL